MPKQCGCDPDRKEFCNEYRAEFDFFMARLVDADNAPTESIEAHHRKQANESQAWLDDHVQGE